MFSFVHCNPSIAPEERRKTLQKRRLEVLLYLRDGVERKLAALNASIETLERQLSRGFDNDIVS